MKEGVYTVERHSDYVNYDEFDSLDKAVQFARAHAWSDGHDWFVMKPIAVAKAPADINSVKVEDID